MSSALKILLMVVSLIAPLTGVAQDKKREVEKRIKAAEMPAHAIMLLMPHLEPARRIRYFRETDLGRVSYECKFKLKKRQYSVEFDTLGTIEDIEIMIDLDKVGAKASDNIIQHLRSYDRHKIRRLQLQFRPDGLTGAALLEQVLSNTGGIRPYYELVTSVRTQDGWSTFEMLFDPEGRFLSQKLVIERQTDIILY